MDKKNAWDSFQSDEISSAEYKRRTNGEKSVFHKAVGKIYSKFTRAQQRKWRAGSLCKNHAQALHMNKQYAEWHNKKFGYVPANLLGVTVNDG